MTRFEATQFLGEQPGADFWCGTWLGGCGTQLTTRVGTVRIPHFAHRPTPDGHHGACHRLHNDRRSADHLFVDRDLTAWARERGNRTAQPVLHGDFHRGGTCTCLDLTLNAGAGDGLVTVVFKGYDMSVWYTGDLVEPSTVAWRSWVFGPGVASPQGLLDRDGYALHLRLDSTDAVGRVEIGTRPPRGGIEWVGLDDCTLDEGGISTPFVAGLRRRRTVIPLAPAPTSALPHASGPATQPPKDLAGAVLVDLDEELDVIPLDERLVDFFAETGATVYDDPQRMRWLRLASVHSSYFHEKHLSEYVDKSVLHGLAELSKRHVRVAVLDRYVNDNHPRKVGQQDEALKADERSAWDALASLPIVEDALHFGRSEAAPAEGRLSKSRTDVVRQIIGLAALLGGHASVRRLLDRALSGTPAASGPRATIDWRTPLEKHVRREMQVWEFDSSGPDHDLQFTARLSTRTDDRSSEGAGPSKKAASHAAAEDFIRRWLPEIAAGINALHDAVSDRPEAPRTFERATPAHQAAVDELVAFFGLSREARPYLAQALTHSSWINENQQVARRAHQRDNTLLANRGSAVADLLVVDRQMHAVLGRTVRPDAGELTLMTPEERSWRELLAQLQLGSGVLLGTRERLQPELNYAGAMQAVFAVAWQFSGPRLLSAPPAFVAEWVRTNGPVPDAATRLQTLCATFGMEWDFDIDRRGEDHEVQHSATVVLCEENARLDVPGTWVSGDKAFARKRSAEHVLDVAREIARSERWDLDPGAQRVAAFLLRAQVKNAGQVSNRHLERCSREGHLGTSYVLAGDDEAYDAWSRQVGDLIGDYPTRSDPQLADFYRRVADVLR